MPTDEQKAKIAQLEAAYEKLLTGQSAVVVHDASGDRVEWQRANLDALKKYIRELKLEYGCIDRRSLRPIGMVM